MDFSAFETSLAQAAPPSGLSAALQGLWWDAKGDWAKAHNFAQDAAGPDGDAVHAYLHRVEGDLPNAAYWYRRAGRKQPAGTLQAEWATLAAEFLSR
jgi:hypothetical protein